MKKITFALVLLTISFSLKAQVSIPDAAFETALISFGMDTDGTVNGQISTTDALAITNLSLIGQTAITDITGVNGMTNLTYFSCYELGLPNFTFILPNLETLSVERNNFTSIDLSGVPNLTTLYIDYNTAITTLDLSVTPLLVDINARNCNISSITTDPNFLYHDVRLSSNAFVGNVDFTNWTNLNILTMSGNTLNSIDITGLTNLTFLAVDNCGLNDLDVTTNTNLSSLTAINNNLTCLDLSQNSLLESIEVNNNDPNLIIVVADVTAADAATGIYQWWFKDATATFASTCTASVNKLSFDSNFDIYPNPSSGVLNIESLQVAHYKLYNMQGKLIAKNNIQLGSNTINLQNIEKGIYFIEINLKNKSFTKKIIKL